VEVIAGDGDGVHLGVAHLQALGIVGVVEFAGDLQTGRGGGRGDQFDDGEAACQRVGAPCLCNMTEEPMLASRAGESHPHALLEPYVNLSIHTAPDVRLPTYSKRQWAKRAGLARTTRSNQ